MAADSLSEEVRQSAKRMSEQGVAALGGLYDLTSQRLVRLALTITRNQHDAEDAVQTALLRVADDPLILCRAENPWPYLLRMVRNEALLILRKRKRIHPLARWAEMITQRFIDQTEQDEQHRAVWGALQKLPVEQTEVVVLKIWEELTFAEIGEVLHISPATAASRYRYGLEKLERKLSAQLDRNDLVESGCDARRSVR